jgi:tripartite-type tricarboxylate transporter receptor subunit TctC
MRRGVVVAAAGLLLPLLLLLGAARAEAQSYPSRNIIVMCGFAAGGGGDLICRYIADRLTPLAGQRAIVENRVGALGSLAAETTARSKPDGYTVLVTPGSATHASYTFAFQTPHYDPVRDFTMVTTLARLTFILVVAPQHHDFTTVKELTDWAKASRSKTGYSTVTGLVSGERYRLMAGIEDMLEVPYKSAQQTILDVLAGELDFMFCDPGLAMAHIPTGALRPIALTAATPSAANPGIPSMADAGFSGYDVSGWWAAYVATGTPAPIVQKLRTWIDEIVARDETREFFARSGIDTFPATPDMDFAAFQRAETEKWKRHFEVAKVPAQ